MATLSTPDALAGTASVTGTKAGATPFISNVTATFTGGPLLSIGYGVVPKSGSLTRPLVVSYAAQYLTSTGALNSTANTVTIPIFGLYAGYTNAVSLYFYFTDGTVNSQTVNITTAAYTDPCSPINSPTFTQGRANTSDLNYDYFILKDTCSGNSPAIVDTDGNIRWVGQASTSTSAIAIFNNQIYLSDNKTGIIAMPLTTATATKLADYSAAPYNVTYTGHHNIDPGRNGLIVDVNTTTQTEAVDLEFNPATGAVLNTWDLGQIISYTMTKGGDSPTKFVLGTTADWFHNNSTAYNPADNTLIVSSRENFVVAVDYDTPADGQKKIHWILGDTSKTWYAYPSLRALMLSPTNAATLPPIGQHAVSIDHNSNLLLFDDGLQSLVQSPAGNSRTYSAVREYQINTSAMTATQGPVYYSPNPTLFSPICGSVYDVNNTFLVDFPTVGDSLSNLGGASTATILQGLGSSENLVFNLQYPEPAGCNSGWNAYPLPSNVFTYAGFFSVSANPATLSLTSPQSSQISVTVVQQQGFTGAVALTATGFPTGVTYSFSGATSSGATLTITAAAGTTPGTYPITITGTSGSLVSSTTLSLTVASAALTPQTITFNPIAAQVAGTTLTLSATATSGLPVSFSVAANGTCSISGNVVSFLNAGSCSVTANQAGNSTYSAAAAVGQTIQVTSAPVKLVAQTITFNPIAAQTVGTTLSLSATATSGLPVSFSVASNGTCSLSGTIIKFLNPGTCGITASQAGNTTYAAAASVQQSVSVSAASSKPLAQTINFNSPSPQFIGSTEKLNASASSGLPVTFSVSPSNVCVLNGTSVVSKHFGYCEVTASQPGNATYAAAQPVQRFFFIYF